MKKDIIRALFFICMFNVLWTAEIGDDLSSLDDQLSEIDARLSSQFDVASDQISQETDAISDLDQKVDQLGAQAESQASGLLNINSMDKEQLLVYRKKLINEKTERFLNVGPKDLPVDDPVTIDRPGSGSEVLPHESVSQNAESQVQDVQQQVESVENELADGAEQEVAHEGAAGLKNAESSALQESEGNFFQRQGRKITEWANRGAEEIKSLNLSIKDAQADINVLKEQIERRTSLVTKLDGTVSERFIADKPGTFGGLSKDQKSVLKEGLKTHPEGVSATYSLKTNPDGSIKIEATIKETTFTHTIKNPTAMEQDLLKGEPSLTINKDGIMTFSKKDLKLAQSINEETAGLKSIVAEKQEALNQSLSKINKVEGPINKFNRWRDNLKRGTMRSLTVKIYKFIIEGFNKLVHTLETLSQAVLFNVPSVILQAMEAKAQQQALFDQIAAPYEIAPGFVVQIPAQLIPPSNPESATFLYVAVPADTPTQANYMTDNQLNNGSYYVLYQNGAPWASTYATASGAPSSWVNLNTGLIFMDQGIPLNAASPYAYLLEPSNDAALALSENAQSTSLSVQNYMEKAFSAVSGGQSSFSVKQSWINVLPWTPSISEEVSPKDKTIENLFTSWIANIAKGDSDSQESGMFSNPTLLVPSLNIFRAGIKNIAGFLPATLLNPAPTLNIKQFVGIGSLNRLLGNPNSGQSAKPTNVVQESLQFMLQIKQSVLQNVVDAQKNLAKVLASTSVNRSDINTAILALNSAESELSISFNNPDTTVGLNPSIDLNGYGIYLYETADTPIAQFLAQHRPISFIAAKDYVVFLDATGAIVPLFVAGFENNTGGIGQIAFNTKQINSSITHMCSLISGFTYTFNSSGGPGEILLSAAGDGKPDFTTAQSAASSLFTQLTTTLKEGQTVINQISALANYATTLVSEGPYQKNNCVLTEVDLSSYATTESLQQATASITEYLNGQGIPLTSSNQTPFGASAGTSSQSNWQNSLYIYKVAKFSSTDSGQLEGVFGKDNQGNPVYDYVVPLATVPSQPGVFQIMQLGMSSLLGQLSAHQSENKIAGSVQLMVSLVTGQVYDADYQLISGTTTVVQRNASFQPMIAQPGQYPFPWKTTDAQGNTTTVNVAAVPGLPLATAYMPTFCNPYNVIYTSLVEGSNSSYTSQLTSVNNANQAVSDAANQVTASLQKISLASNQSAAVSTIWKMMQSNALQNATGAQNALLRLKSYFQPESVNQKTGYIDAQAVYQAIQKWIAALIFKNKQLDGMKTIISKQQMHIKPPYPSVSKQNINSVGLPKPGVVIAKSESQMLQIPPMYWLYFSNYVYCSMQPDAVSYTANNTNVSSNLNWISVTPCASPLAFSSNGTSYNLGQALPIAFVAEVIRCYKGWSESQDQNNIVAQVMQSGPFQLTNNLLYNVYLNLPPGSTSIGQNEVAQGNFFYTVSPVFQPTELFVMGDISSITQPITLADCNAENHLGLSFLDSTNKAIISIVTGDVWVPAQTTQATSCYNASSTGSDIISKAMCNLTKIGTLDPQQVLLTALQNQQAGQAETTATLAELLENLQAENPSLYAMIMNCQTLSGQQAQSSNYPFYFAGKTLRLCPNSGNIYAVVKNEHQSYLQADDYLITIDDRKQPLGTSITPATSYMMSLVSTDIFGANSQSVITNSIMPTYGSALIQTPQEFLEKIFGTGSYATAGATTFQSIPSTNPTLYNRIQELNQVVNASYLKKVFQTSNNGNGIVAAQLPLADLQSAKPLSGIFNNVYQVNGKYYLKIPGDTTRPSVWYDFNAERVNPTYNPNATTSSQAFTYSVNKGNAKRGVYYLVSAPDAQNSTSAIQPTLTASPISEVTGYAWQAMLDRFGITIDSSGNELLGLPVSDPSLPMTTADKNLLPGQSSGKNGNMQCLHESLQSSSSATSITSSFANAQVYYYVNNAAQMYLARRVFTETIPVFNAATNSTSMINRKEDYYVDLATGSQYDVFGNPYLAPVSVAYLVASSSDAPLPSPLSVFTNNDFDFSNPLFITSNLDVATGALNPQIMYQNTDPNGDPNYGYNQYKIKPYSMQFVLTSGSSSTPTVYAYGNSQDNNGNPFVTQNGTQISPATTDMSSVLQTAFNNGMYLVTKTYTMNLNGVEPTAATPSSSTITVTESGAQPLQYAITYTDSSGIVITDIFQSPTPNQAVTVASSNNYNNPPLDENLQNIMVQAKPFCAQVLGSRPFGQTGSPLTAFSGDSAPTVCGLLHQPASATSFDLRSVGILGLTFVGPNPNNANTFADQYFSFFDAYNGAAQNASGASVAQPSVPRAGGYSTYISVVSSVNNLYGVSPYPGVYAGSFTNAFLSSQTSLAPYLCISSLTGTINQDSSTSLTEFSAPAANGVTEYVYGYQYGILSDNQLSALKDKVNISPAVGGVTALVSAFDASDLQSVSIENSEFNPQAAEIIKEQVSFAKPLISLKFNPPGRYLYKLSCSSSQNQDAQAICDLLGVGADATLETALQFYIDIVCGIVFVQKTDQNGNSILYPYGFALTNGLLSIISKIIGGAIPGSNPGSVTIQNPAPGISGSVRKIPSSLRTPN